MTVQKVLNGLIYALAADTKPTNHPTNTLCVIMDTGDIYRWNGSSWVNIIGTSATSTLLNKTINVVSNPILHIGQYKYEIFKDGSTWYCRNNATGAIDSSNTDPTTPLQYAINNAGGYGIKVKADTLQTTAVINCVDKYFTLEGEGYGTSGASPVAGATVIQANFTGATGNAVFNCVNTGYTKQHFKNLVIDANNNVDYGINAFGVRECEEWTKNLSIIRYKKSGMKMEACWMSSIQNTNIISGTSPVTGSIGIEMVRGTSPACNTIRVSKGRIALNDINISMDGTNGNMIEGTALESAGVSAIKTFNGSNANTFRDCSFEYNLLSSIVVVDEAGNANVYENCRFDAFHTAYNIITVRAGARNLVFAKNMIQANAAGTTATIIIETGAQNIDFIGNKQLTNTPLTVTVTDNQASETQYIGNSFIQDKLRLGIQFGSNKLWLKELDANTLNLYASDGTTMKNFRANAGLFSTVRTTGAVDMVTFPDSSTISLNGRTLTNVNLNTSTATNSITATSTAAGDILKSNGTKFDRFARGASALQVLRVNPGNTDIEWASLNSENTGIATASGNGSTTVFNIAHSIGATPTVFTANLLSHSINTTVTAGDTNIVVTCASAPSSGTNNVKIYWRAVA